MANPNVVEVEGYSVGVTTDWATPGLGLSAAVATAILDATGPQN